MRFSNIFIIALAILFFILGFNALQDAKPSPKDQKIYNIVKPYIPYYLEKRVGGFSILSKEDNIKEKPPITEVFHRLEQLEKGWGMKHLKLVNNQLNIYNNKQKLIKTINNLTKDDIDWIKQYFGVVPQSIKSGEN